MLELVRQPTADGVTLAVTGRLDAHWSMQLDRELGDIVRSGARQITLDFAGVDFMSSAGIRVIFKGIKELGAIGGALRLINAVDRVQSILTMSGVAALLAKHSAATVSPAAADSFTLDRGAALTVEMLGSPRDTYAEGDAQTVAFPANAFGFGLGAFGGSATECRDRYGEFIAAGGTAAYLPADGSETPDYLAGDAQFVPAVSVLYGLKLAGGFRHLARFAATDDPLTLTELAQRALAEAKAPAAGFMIVAESTGLVGAALRRSPMTGSGDKFAHPAVREWLGYTVERAHRHALALVVGVAATAGAEPPALAPLLRPLAEGLSAHCHALIVSYRPLPDGKIDAGTIIRELLATQEVLGVLHLLHDRRPATGVGDSEFVRGALWSAPLAGVGA
ncbi:MAG TPA: STAS domain-containing protein [bacterium]|nr:STAS domain-containing protein [bacterium]